MYSERRRRRSRTPPPRRRNDFQSVGQPSPVIGVFGLDVKADERDLYTIFSVFGSIKDIQVVYDSLSGKSRGFAFVYFRSTEEASKAVEECNNGLKILGKTVRVDFSKTTKPHDPTPGVYMGHEKQPRNRRGSPHRRGRFSPRSSRRFSPEENKPRRRHSRSRSRSNRRSRRRYSVSRSPR